MARVDQKSLWQCQSKIMLDQRRRLRWVGGGPWRSLKEYKKYWYHESLRPIAIHSNFRAQAETRRKIFPRPPYRLQHPMSERGAKAADAPLNQFLCKAWEEQSCSNE